jgi:RNA polymerase sigma-70 factor, ECF subfamily
MGTDVQEAFTRAYASFNYRRKRREPQRAHAPSADAEVLTRVPDHHLLRALHQLPVAFRIVVYLSDVEGHTYREIADLIGMPTRTVMSRLHRGRRRLREHLRE